MPGPVKIRTAFGDDRVYLDRLVRSIERDPNPRRTAEWRERVTRDIRDLLLCFERADLDDAEERAREPPPAPTTRNRHRGDRRERTRD